MKISIITVCFNAKDTIEETFLSVINQTYKNFEYIVIDGASSDGTLEIIDKYKENISYILSESDKGVYEAMNKGLKRATGDFIFFLNANDAFYDEHILEKVVQTLKENPERKILFGDISRVSEDKKTKTIEKYAKVQNVFYFINNNICHQCIFYHKSLFEQFGGYSEEYQIFSDWDFNIKCMSKNNVPSIYLPIPIANFQMGGICTNNGKYKKIYREEHEKLIQKHFSDISFIINSDKYLMKTFKTIYQIFRNDFLITKLLDLLTYQEKYKLNIKKYKNETIFQN